MPKERGPERDFVVKWAFDMEYGGCSRFWWGGTVSKEFRKIALSDQTALGFFREETETTLKQKRNAMRSVSIQKANGYLQTSNFFCKSETCLTIFDKACNLPMVPGPCEGSYFHYGYNPERGICEQFKYGGCLGELVLKKLQMYY